MQQIFPVIIVLCLTVDSLQDDEKKFNYNNNVKRLFSITSQNLKRKLKERRKMQLLRTAKSIRKHWIEQQRLFIQSFKKSFNQSNRDIELTKFAQKISRIKLQRLQKLIN